MVSSIVASHHQTVEVATIQYRESGGVHCEKVIFRLNLVLHFWIVLPPQVVVISAQGTHFVGGVRPWHAISVAHPLSENS